MFDTLVYDEMRKIGEETIEALSKIQLDLFGRTLNMMTNKR
jgi:hypothetical protein